MIQWIIYFPELNHSRSYFLPCRQKPLYFTHGSQLAFIEAFKTYLNTERFKKSCFIFLGRLLSWYHFVPVFLNFSVLKAEEQHVPILWLCSVTGQGNLGFYFEIHVSFEYIYNFYLFITIFMSIYVHVCHYFSPKRFWQINKSLLDF